MDKKLIDWLESRAISEGAPPPDADEPLGVPVPGLATGEETPVAPPDEAEMDDLPELPDNLPDDPGVGSEQPEDSPPNQEAPEQEPDKEEDVELLNFEDFRESYIDLSVNAKPEELVDKLGDLSGIVDLGPREKKFMSDNMQILQLMEDKDIYEASRKIHHTEDPMEMLSQVSEEIDRVETLRNVTLKLPSFFGMKSDLYRKFVAALTGGVQVGGGTTVEDIVVSPTKGQRTLICTRFYTLFGYIEIIPWSLGAGDADLFLRDVERERLERGAPEEKKVLLKRILIASISKVIGSKNFMICVVNRSSGRRTDFALRFDKFLNDGYENGHLKVRIEKDEEELAITADGETMNPGKLVISFVDPEAPESRTPFIEWKDGSLYLVADADTIEKAAEVIGSSFFKRTNFEGTDEELETIQKCIPTLPEMILRRC